METASGDRRIRQKHVLGHRQHCGNFRLIGDALQGGCQCSKPGFCALIRERDAQVVPEHLLVGAHAGRHAVADMGEHLPELEAQLLEFGRGIRDGAEHGSGCWLAPPTMPPDRGGMPHKRFVRVEEMHMHCLNGNALLPCPPPPHPSGKRQSDAESYIYNVSTTGHQRPGCSLSQALDPSAAESRHFCQQAIRSWGNSLAWRLPADCLRQAGMEEGDQIEIVSGEDGRLNLMPMRQLGRSALVADLSRLQATMPLTPAMMEQRLAAER